MRGPSTHRRLVRIVSYAFITVLLSACAAHQPFSYRQTWPGGNPEILYTYNYADPAAENYFRTAVDSTLVRNRVLYELMGIFDDYYYKNTVNIRDGVVGKNLLVSFSGIATSFAAALAGGEQIKTVLSAISGGLQTINGTFDKEALLNTSVQALRFQMDASRAVVAAGIIEAMDKNLADYPLEAGLRDLIRYYDAGTVTSALTALAQTTALQKAAAEQMEARVAGKPSFYLDLVPTAPGNLPAVQTPVESSSPNAPGGN